MSVKEKNPVGRPPIWTQERREAAIELILKEISNGKGLVKICTEYKNNKLIEHFPSKDIIYKWLKEDKKFSDKYIEAKQRQADFYAEEIINICDQAAMDAKEDSKNTCLQNARKLKVDALKWYTSKLAPKFYGRTDITLIQSNDNINAENLNEKELDAQIAGLIKQQKELKGEK